MDPLFTSGNDTVDINGVVAGTYIDGTQYAAGDGNDTVILADAANAATAGFVIGTAFDGGAGADTITGGDGNDLILGGTDNDSLSGGAGNDTLDGGLGADTLDGGADSDTVSYANAAAGVAVNLTAGTGGDGDTLVSIENVVGSAYADTITGATAGGGTLDGGNGNDSFILNGSGNTVIGGSGSDTVSYANAASGVAIDLAAGTGGSGDTYGSVENAIGSGYADTITGAAISGARLDGGAGDDIIVVNGASTTVVGGSGSDTVSYANAASGVAVNLMTGTGGSGDIYSGIENVIGSGFADTITGGTATGTVLDGGAGNDTIVVRRSNTTVIGGSGTDIVSYANATAGVTVDLPAGTSSNGDSLSGIEGVTGSAYEDTITGSTVSGGTLDGGNGDDLIAVNAGGTTIIGGGGKDMLSYASATAGVSVSLAAGTSSTGDTLSGIEGITGSAYVDTLTGGSGNDTLDGGAGADILDGGSGNDTVSYYSATAGVTVDLVAGTNSDGDSYTSIEAVTGSTFNDTITGGTGQAWTIDGGAGDDVVVANAANTVLMGGAGADTITGFSGVETAAYWKSTAGVTVSLATGTGTGGDAQGDVLSAINNLEGSGYGDSLTGDANANRLSGLDGNDYLNGGSGTDTIYGGDGNDTIDGGFNSDTMDGGAGLDWVSYAGESGAGYSAHVNLQTGLASVWLGGGTLVNYDNVSNIEGVFGTAQNDTVSGSAGDDWFHGGGGADTFVGYGGSDTIVYWNSSAAVSLALVPSTLGAYATGSGGDAQGDQIHNTVENIEGSAYGDTLTGNDIANRLVGLNGNDTLNGGSGTGNDTLDGGAGNDSLTGGSGTGADLLIGGTGNDTLHGGNNGGVDRAQFGGVSTDYQITVSGETITVTDLNTADGDDGTDVLTSVEQLVFSNTTLSYQTVTGTSGDDYLQGTSRDETITGGDGNDTIAGGLGADTINGGNGLDWAVFAHPNALGISVNLATGGVSINNGLGWGAHAAQLTSIEGIRGSTYSDNVQGSTGDDWFEGGAGGDTFVGYGGSDTIVYWNSSAAVSLALVPSTLGAYATGSGGDAQGDQIHNTVENIEGSAYGDTLTGNDIANRLVGLNGNDTLNGGSGTGNDTLDGGAGNDSLTGGSGTGADLLIGGTGNDTLHGGNNGGVDRAQFGGVSTDYQITVSGETITVADLNTADGDDGTDVLTSVEQLVFSNTTLSYQTVTGTSGDDYLQGTSRDETITGGDGNDTIAGGLGADTINGGNGLDWAVFAHPNALGISVNLATGGVSINNGLGWGAHAAQLTSIEGIRGSTYSDNVQGSTGDDWFEGGAGGDTFVGYGGSDTIVYWNSSAAVSLALVPSTLGAYATGSGGDAQGDQIHNTVENIEGSAYGDTLTGNDIANRLVGLNGNDTLNGGSGTGNDTLDGGAGNDSLTGGSGTGADLLIGGTGNDTLHGGNNGGVDRAQFGGVSTDYQITVSGETITVADLNTADGDDGTDVLTSVEQLVFSNTTLSYQTVTGTSGDDYLQGTSRDETITGGDGNDTIAGGLGADTINGGNGLDWAVFAHPNALGISVNLATGGVSINNGLGWGAHAAQLTSIEGIRGSTYSDNVQGSTGDDWFEGGAGGDTFVGYGGSDTIVYWNSSAAVSLALVPSTLGAYATGSGGDAQGDQIHNTVENIEGSAYGDTLTGNDIANRLVGLNGNDTLNGGSGTGNDTLDGGAGNDSLTGGSGTGADLLIGGTGNDTLHGGNNGGVDRAQFGGVSTDYQITVSGETITVTDLNTADGDDGTDVLTSVEQLVFSNTTLSYQTVTGTSGDDYLQGTSRDETITGGDGNDTIAGGLGADTINGGNGLDWAVFAHPNALGISVNLATGGVSINNGLGWGAHAAQLTSIEGIRGSTYSDNVQGSTGDDWFEGGAGGDTFVGYEGSDTIVYWNSSAAVSLALLSSSGYATGSGGDAQGDQVHNTVDNIEGSAYGDTLTGNSTANRLVGLNGNDTLSGGAGNDTLVGGNGNDSLAGGDGSDLYLQRRGEGVDTVVQAGISDASTTTDTLRFASGVAYDQLWFRQSGNDLLIDVIGEASSQTVVKDWYSDTGRRVDVIETEDGSHSLTAANVAALVSAMASYSLPSVGTYTLDSTTHGALDTTFASTWS